MAAEKLVRKFGDIKRTVAQYDSELSSMKSPDENSKEKMAQIKARISQSWSNLFSATTSGQPRLQQDIVELIGQLMLLEIEHNNKFQDDSKLKISENIEKSSHNSYS